MYMHIHVESEPYNTLYNTCIYMSCIGEEERGRRVRVSGNGSERKGRE